MRLNDINVRYVGKYDMLFPSRWYNCYEVPEPHRADVDSKFKIIRDLKYAYYHDERLPIRPIVTSETYYIDDVVVDEKDKKTWEDVFKIISDNIQAITDKAPKRLKIMESDDTVIWSFVTDDLQGERANCVILDDFYYKYELPAYELPAWKANNPALKNIKENEDMPKIVNYKYNEEKGLTEITWNDKTITRVVAGDDTEKSAYVGFVSACAKKLFGNKSTYLNQFDKWAVKKPEQERKKVEAEKAKAKEQAKIEAERAERAKEKEANRLAKLWAKQYKRENERIKIAEAAEKIAKDKYGIPDDWFGNDYCCECSCKEFDNLDTEDITDEDITD